jgi:hypothetical protein
MTTVSQLGGILGANEFYLIPAEGLSSVYAPFPHRLSDNSRPSVTELVHSGPLTLLPPKGHLAMSVLPVVTPVPDSQSDNQPMLWVYVNILAYLASREEEEYNPHDQTDLRIAWIIVYLAQTYDPTPVKGYPMAVTEAWYKVLGTHPDKVWGKICHDREQMTRRTEKKKPAPVPQKAKGAIA